MAAIARVLWHNFPVTGTVIGVFRTIGMFGAAGLFVSLLMATYGLDLSAGFF
jgi:hypothetical protein